MIIIPGLSQPLKAAGKRIDSWVEDGDKLMVKADSAVRRAACPWDVVQFRPFSSSTGEREQTGQAGGLEFCRVELRRV